MLNRLKQLNKQTGVTMYLCDPQAKKMVTLHDGKDFDGEIPLWMLNFVNSTSPLLSFEQKGQQKQYFRLKLENGQFLVILDDPSFVLLNQMINKMLEPNDTGTFDNAVMHVKAALESEKKLRERDLAEIEMMKESVAALKMQNSDQAARLKEAFTQNSNLSNEIRQLKSDDIKSEGQKLRSTVTLLRNENTRVTKQLRQADEKLRNLQDKYNELLKESHISATLSPETQTSHTGKGGLFHLVSVLNKVIETGDASAINIETLSMITPISSRTELECNPAAVKALIAKLLGMERSGHLSALQIKKLNDAVGG
ncbi:MAG: hypothetical protein LBH05_08170 [Deferribacteraceae bacterium]|jgi:hypothetical protein|nr:hypothetical protein [Deferribacteraceae bacterium]